MPSGEFDNKAGVPKSESHDEVTGTSKPIADSVKGRKFKESWKTTFPWVMKDPGETNDKTLYNYRIYSCKS